MWPRARAGDELRRLEGQGDFLVGVVRAAESALKPPGPTAGEPVASLDQGLEGFRREAADRLAAAKAGLARALAEDEARVGEALLAIRGVLRERVARFLTRLRPRLLLMPRPMGQRRIIHLARVSRDDSVLLLFLFTGSIPSRYDFLFDDSTEDARLAPPSVYPEEGLSARPTAETLRALLLARRDVLPVKGQLPLLLPSGALFRFLQRGPVLEAEVADGEGFRNLLLAEEAEQLAGHLLRLKLEGQVELELEA